MIILYQNDQLVELYKSWKFKTNYEMVMYIVVGFPWIHPNEFTGRKQNKFHSIFSGRINGNEWYSRSSKNVVQSVYNNYHEISGGKKHLRKYICRMNSKSYLTNNSVYTFFNSFVLNRSPLSVLSYKEQNMVQYNYAEPFMVLYYRTEPIWFSIIEWWIFCSSVLLDRTMYGSMSTDRTHFGT
jgi:hypothetical protein